MGNKLDNAALMGILLDAFESSKNSMSRSIKFFQKHGLEIAEPSLDWKDGLTKAKIKIEDGVYQVRDGDLVLFAERLQGVWLVGGKTVKADYDDRIISKMAFVAPKKKTKKAPRAKATSTKGTERVLLVLKKNKKLMTVESVADEAGYSKGKAYQELKNLVKANLARTEQVTGKSGKDHYEYIAA